MQRRIWLLVIVLAGCGNKKDSSGAAGTSGKPPAAARPQGKLTVTFDGKPVAMATALAWPNGDGDIELTASSASVACDDVTGPMRDRLDGEVTFNVGLRYLLAPAGPKPNVVWKAYNANADSGTWPTTASGDGSPGKPTTLDVDFSITGMALHDEPAHTLVVKGTIDALGCAVKTANPRVAPPAMPATIEIAGMKLPVRGAQLVLGDPTTLALYTGSETCAQKDLGAARSDLRVVLTWSAKAATVSQLEIGGEALRKTASITSFEPSALTVTPSPPTGPGELEVHADVKVLDYPVKVDGKVTAVVCPH